MLESTGGSAKTDKQIMDAGAVAEYFGVSKRTATRWMEDGRVPSFRLGLKRLTRRDALDKLTSNLVVSSCHERTGQQEGSRT